MFIKVKNTYTGHENAQEILTSILRSRGLNDEGQIHIFLHPSPPTLNRLLQGISVNTNSLTQAKDTVMEAVEAGEDILVFGDYDADGITSTAIMWQTLMVMAKGSGARVMPFIPDRARHGYGLSSKAVEDIFDGTAFGTSVYPDFKPTLIITVDNGIVANSVVAGLKEKGTKVIITDHHQAGEILPEADSIIHALETSGAGVAWLSALYFTNENDAIMELIELATIGIVADQMPLVGINRDIVTEGLKKLSHTRNLGLQALLQNTGVKGRAIGAYEINYVIGPRLNAVGRLDNPLDALRLLCSRDPSQIAGIAARVEMHNSNRQVLTEEAIKVALSHPVDHPIVVEASPDYHEGIIGLIASKLVETYHRPAVVISIGDDSAKGSARSLSGVNITEVLRQLSGLLTGVGGHELAGGFSLKVENIPAFTDALYQYADSHIDLSRLEKAIEVEGQLCLSQVTRELADYMSKLEPFGMGNQKPRFVFKDVHVLEDRIIGKNGNHRKMVIEQDGVSRDVIWFNGQAKHPIDHLDSLVCTIELNEWRDRVTVQLNAQYVEV